jgi:hypothetical protein
MTNISKTNASKRVISAFPADKPTTKIVEPSLPAAAVDSSLLSRLENPVVPSVTESVATQAEPEAASETHFLMPDHFDVITDQDKKVTLRLEAYKTQCLSCSHLVPSAKEKFTDCHASAGNLHCPAASAQIVFVGRRNHFLQKLVEARAGGDINRLNNILHLLRKEPTVDQEYVMKKAGVL